MQVYQQQLKYAAPYARFYSLLSSLSRNHHHRNTLTKQASFLKQDGEEDCVAAAVI
jgi:hypothetical protein